MPQPKRPSKEQVRHWIANRHTEHKALPDIEQIKRELGWGFAKPMRCKS